MLTRVSYTTSRTAIVDWLLEEGFISRMGMGKTGQAQLYRATTKAAHSPETPYPPLRETDPFSREKAAAIRIVDLLLRADPYAKKTAQTIADACNVLLARFDGSRAENENDNTEEDATC